MTLTLKKYRLPLFIACLLISAQVVAEDPKVEKKKTYTKSYNVNSNDKIAFTNQFGELKINTWDKNEVKATVTITAEASTDEKAQAILDRISIEDGKSNDGVYFKTKFAKEKDNWSRGEKQGFHIDYEVYVPARNPLVAQNSFGPMIIGDYQGETTLTSQYGSLNTGKLGNVKKVLIQYGKGDIGSINNGSLVIQYSKATIGSINNVDLTIQYSKATFDNLDGSVKASFDYCDVARLRVDNNTKMLTVNNNYSNLYLDVNSNISANFDINTNYGSLHNKTNIDIKENITDDEGNRRGPRFSRKYSGKSGSGSTNMKIRANYGNVTLGHNLNININKDENRDRDRDRDKDKDKDKNKDKKGTVRI
jgi:hypothetical protein